MLEYEPSLNGVLLNKEDCRNVRLVFKGDDDGEFFQVSIEEVPHERTLSTGQTVTINILSIAYSKG